METGRLNRKTVDRRLPRNGNKYGQFYAYYTILFAIVFMLAFCWYIFVGKSFIWEKDGWDQHYKAMIYFARYIRKIGMTLITQHTLSLKQWDFTLGEGNDVLQAMHYYIIGDPFSLPCVLVPTKYMWIYYDFAVVLRLYCSGLVFSWLCFNLNKTASRFAVMAGTISYVFCYWSILNVGKHPFFLNPMVFFPLIILGIEKVIKFEKPYVLILAVCFSGTSNFYLFYMIVLLTVVYLIVRAFVLYKTQFSKIFSLIIRVGIFAALGAAMAAVILIPVCYDFLNDARMGGESNFYFVYPFEYYTMLPGMFVSGNMSYWLCMGYSSSTVLGTVLLLSKKKQYKTLKILFLICAVIVLVPAFGQILNGMSYMSNRWCWALALLCSYASVVIWPELIKAKRRDVIILLAFVAVTFIICVLGERARAFSAYTELIIALLFVVLIIIPLKGNSFKTKQLIALVLVVLSIANMSCFSNAPSMQSSIIESTDKARIQENQFNNETKIVKKIAKKEKNGFYRYTGKDITLNAGTLAGVSGTNYYWSISNTKLADFIGEMELVETKPQMRYGYDSRLAIDALSSVKYYAVSDGDKDSRVPYGFEYIDEADANKETTKETKEELAKELGVNKLKKKHARGVEKLTKKNYAIFRNKYALPLGYTYDNAIGDSKWNSLSAVEKQEAMLQAVYLNEYTGEEEELSLDTKPVEYTVDCKGKNIRFENNEFTVTGKNAVAELQFEGVDNSETYFTVKGLDFKGMSEYDLYFTEKDEEYPQRVKYSKTAWNLLPKIEQNRIKREKRYWEEPLFVDIDLYSSSGYKNTIEYATKKYPWYMGIHEYSVNLGYDKKAVNSIKIVFPEPGVYSFDSIELLCQPFDNYEQRIAALKEDVLKTEKIENNTVSGTVNLDKEKYLCLSIPYSKGWSAYVDGEKAEILQANVRYMAIKLSPGKHEIKLQYRTPLLKIGILVSLAAGTVFVVMIVFDLAKYKRKRKRQRERAQRA